MSKGETKTVQQMTRKQKADSRSVSDVMEFAFNSSWICSSLRTVRSSQARGNHFSSYRATGRSLYLHRPHFDRFKSELVCSSERRTRDQAKQQSAFESQVIVRRTLSRVCKISAFAEIKQLKAELTSHQGLVGSRSDCEVYVPVQEVK